MNDDVYTLANAGVRSLNPYQAGKPIAELQRELGLQSVVKLASNENPLGPSEAVDEACRQALQDSHRYPDSNGFALKNALADKLQLQPQQITLGCGSNEILDLIARVFLAPGGSAVYSQHAFIVYALAVQASGAEARVVAARDWGHDLTAMAAAVDDSTRLVFLANPNNPTGSWFEHAALAAFMQQIPQQTLVVLDEAYIEYAEDWMNMPDSLALLAQYPNLIITRTFSKAYGLAGLRVGYSLSNVAIADLLNRLRPPFNVNSLALAAAEAALQDQAYIARSREINRQGLQQLTAGLQQLGLSWIPSAGNFISVEMPGPAAEYYQALLRKGVIVRPVEVYQMPEHLRVSIGLTAENEAFLQAMAEIMGPTS